MPLPTDPMLSQQWHLGSATPGTLDLDVRAVWSPAAGGEAYTGRGVTVFVMDGGFDYLHPDFDTYDQTLDYDFGEGDDDPFAPFGMTYDGHGTAVTGLIAAAADGEGAVGVAFGARVSGLAVGNLETGVAALAYAAANGGDVVNQSMGLTSMMPWNPFLTTAQQAAVDGAIGAAVAEGRGGLGMVIVKSADNYRAAGFDTNVDIWNRDTRQVVVAAVDRDGSVSSYSSFGASVLVSAFGTEGEVVTTDRVGTAGYDPGDFTTFGGTSAAAPMVSGVVALMLEAAPGLGWRDVQAILAASARQVGSAVGAAPAGDERFGWTWNGSETWNGGGMHVSNDYGYGLVDARAAVRLAETWLLGGAAATSANEALGSADLLAAARAIPDGAAGGATFAGAMGRDLVVERVTVTLDLSAADAGQLQVRLISPDGTVGELVRNSGGGRALSRAWTFESQSFRGEDSGGEWRVVVADTVTGGAVTVRDVVVRAYGADTADDRLVFTDTFSRYQGRAGQATAFRDGDGGVDTVNLAAVSSASRVLLSSLEASRVDGVAVTFDNGFENAVGGDRGDLLSGNVRANQLLGMRGNDSLLGLGGADTLEGGAGNDTLTGGQGADRLFGGQGRDVFDFNAASDSGAAGRDRITRFDGAGGAAGDRIDLQGIDADATLAGDQAFVLAATGAAGTLRLTEVGGMTVLWGFLDAVAGADLRIDIADGTTRASDYRASDFLL